MLRTYAPAAYPEYHCQTTIAIPRTIGVHAPAIFLHVIVQAHPSLLPERQVV